MTVITNLFSLLDPGGSGDGTRLVTWLWGGLTVDRPDLNEAF